MSALPERIRDRADVERLLASATNYEQQQPDGARAFDLERIRGLLAALGSPHLGPRTLQVAGSKGKGSTVRMLAAALTHAGLGPVGLYTSPHLADLSERIAIDGTPVSDAALARALDGLLPHARARHATPEALTFFELLTAAAWLVFREAGCREVVLETGLGGRLDATTVCRPALTAITTIELEHTQLLGATLELIAAEKAGVLKAGVPCVTGAEGAALAVIERRAHELGVPLAALGREILLEGVRTEPGPVTHARVRVDAEILELTLPLAGAHQARNAALAAAMLLRLGLSRRTIEAALAEVRLPAALEPFPGAPLVVLDGAHTPASARAALEGLGAAWPRRPHVLLLALLAEKQVEAILATLVPSALAVVSTQVASPRALPAAALALRARAHAPVGTPVEAVADPREALARARALATGDALVLVTGSLYLAGALRPLLQHGA